MFIRVGGSGDPAKDAGAIDTAGDSTISPQSSSSKSSSLSICLGGGFVSSASRPSQGFASPFGTACGGCGTGGSDEMISASSKISVDVAVRLWLIGSFGRGERSREPPRPTCRCSLVTAMCLGGTPEDSDRESVVLSFFQGSSAAEEELQPNAAGTAVERGCTSLLDSRTGFEAATTERRLARNGSF